MLDDCSHTARTELHTVPLLGLEPEIGDDVYVTGTLGDAALGLRVLQEGRGSRTLKKRRRVFFVRRVDCGSVGLLQLSILPPAMIDVSDGLLQDLGHICEASKVGADIEGEHLPLSLGYRALRGRERLESALTGGEDYELLFTAPVENNAPRLLKSLSRALDNYPYWSHRLTLAGNRCTGQRRSAYHADAGWIRPFSSRSSYGPHATSRIVHAACRAER